MYGQKVEKQNVFDNIVSEAMVFAFPKDVEGNLAFALRELMRTGMYPYKVVYKDEQAEKEAEKQGFVFHFLIFCLKPKVYEC